ncbi:MAG: RluA family pseudouridine synthase [Desulfofustis sp.]|jgi:23S rRNA pseudouridine1911/1915/1917 synthase
MVERYLTAAKDGGQRLDQFLAENSSSLSRTNIRSIIDIGGVHVDGKRVRKAGLRLTPGRRVEIYQDRGSLKPFRLQPHHVLFQDPHIIVLDKPAGIETQPTPARYRGTLYEALQVWLKRDRSFGRRLEIGMAQRLDRDTSGVIIFSIHPRAHKSISVQMQSRTVKKTYVALVEGKPEPAAGSYQSNIVRDRRTGSMKSVAAGGKYALTHYRVIKTRSLPEIISLVELELITGRTHQIRVHLAEAGHPLLGDVRYGGRSSLGEMTFARHCLHSRQLEIEHPESGKCMSFSAELPTDMLILETMDRSGNTAAPADET